MDLPETPEGKATRLHIAFLRREHQKAVRLRKAHDVLLEKLKAIGIALDEFDKARKLFDPGNEETRYNREQVAPIWARSHTVLVYEEARNMRFRYDQQFALEELCDACRAAGKEKP